jgi:RNA polymerase-binding transcription factor DksA
MTVELTDQQIDFCKQALLQRKQALREEIKQELLKQDSENYISLAGTVHDLEEESLASLLVDVNLADVDRHIEEDRDINAALLRIQDGSYSICISCLGGIPIDRLQAYPTAKRCLPCQQHYEQTHQTTEVHTL